jgi:small-conductance mechanosensitive channel
VFWTTPKHHNTKIPKHQNYQNTFFKMKYLGLFLKAIILIFFALIRLEEIDMVQLLANFRYRKTIGFYFDTLSGIIIFLLLVDFIKVGILYFYRRRHKVRGEDNYMIGVGQIYTLLVYMGFIFGFMALFKIAIKEVFTSLSIIFAGIAILTKDYVSNMINGMIITFSGQLTIGDNVRIGLHRGRIVDITLQNIHLLNDDDDYIYIPNNLVFVSDVINYTKRQVKRTSIEFEIDLKYLTNVEELERNMIETLRPFHLLIKEDSYYLRVTEVKKDLVMMKFQYILKEPNKELERQIRRKTIRRLVDIISDREKIVDNISELPE